MKIHCRIHGEVETAGVKRPRCRICAFLAVKKRRIIVKKMGIEYKGGKCERCGYNRCIEALEFHHLNPEEKDFQFSGNGNCKSWNTVKKELDKCILVCSNCHREIHSQTYIPGSHSG